MKILSTDRYDSKVDGRPLIIGYFTVGTPYQDEAEVLRLSLETVGYSYEICGVPNLGSWQKNTQFKADFVRMMLEKYPGRPMVYLDVDAIMVQSPVLFENIDGDIAAVHFIKSIVSGVVHLSEELLSGTVYFANTPACRKVVDAWLQINARHPKTLPNGREAWDQRTLEMAIKQTPSCRFVELPQEYTWITELTQRRAPGLAPVIMHTRGAKRFKNRINGKKGYA